MLLALSFQPSWVFTLPAFQENATWFDYTNLLGSSGNGVTSGGAERYYPALTPNDECNPTSSSLSPSGLSDTIATYKQLPQYSATLKDRGSIKSFELGAKTGNCDANITVASVLAVHNGATKIAKNGYGARFSYASNQGDGSLVQFALLDGGWNYKVGTL